MKSAAVKNIGELPSAMEEAVNRLRISIGFTGENVRRILITSAFPGEGKSTVALSLWRQMAQADFDCVLVDMDLRNSGMHARYPFEVSGEGTLCGTSDFLAGRAALEDCIVHSQYPHGDIMMNLENVKNASLLAAGSSFRNMMEELTERYRYVFLDAPALDAASDPLSIGACCDGCLIVVQSGRTSARAVRSVADQIRHAGCPVLGYILNRA